METISVKDVQPLRDFVVELSFSDGTRRQVDLEPYLQGGVLEEIRKDKALYETLDVRPGERTISWANGVDIDPYSLYLGIIPDWDRSDDELEGTLAARRASSNSPLPCFPLNAADKEVGLR